MHYNLLILTTSVFGAVSPKIERCLKGSKKAIEVPGQCSGYDVQDKVFRDGSCYKSCGQGFTGVGSVCVKECKSPYPFPCGATCATSADTCPDESTALTAENADFFGNIGILAKNAADNQPCKGLKVTKPLPASDHPNWISQLKVLILNHNPTRKDSVIHTAAQILIDNAVAGKQIDWAKEKSPESKAALAKTFKNGICK